MAGEGDNRGWDGWMASPTQWTWVWVSFRSWRWTGRPGVLQSMGLQRVEHDWATELNWTDHLFRYIKLGNLLPVPRSNVRDLGLVPGSGRFLEKENGNPLSFSCLEILIDGGAWQATVYGVTKSRTGLGDWSQWNIQNKLHTIKILLVWSQWEK